MVVVASLNSRFNLEVEFITFYSLLSPTCRCSSQIPIMSKCVTKGKGDTFAMHSSSTPRLVSSHSALVLLSTLMLPRFATGKEVCRMTLLTFLSSLDLLFRP